MSVHGLGHQGQRRDIAIVPQPAFEVGRDITRMVDFHFLGRNYRPAAFRLHAAHCGQRTRVAMPHAVAMGYLIESVAGGDRSDFHRLEEDVVARIASHSSTVQLDTAGAVAGPRWLKLSYQCFLWWRR